MNLLDKAALIGHILRWRVTWNRRDTSYRPDGLPGLFTSARDAVARIPDGAVVVSAGMAANARCSLFYWALAERYAATGRPRWLTWISVGAQGGRGRVPGTVEELAAPGLLARYISGHVETAKALLAAAERGDLELHVLPQGEMAHLIEAQADGVMSLASRTGVGTFLDPRVGRGSPVTAGATDNLITADGDTLVYRLPPITVGLFSAPWADADGGVYFRQAATITENVESVRAARANGGLGMAVVHDLCPAGDTPPDVLPDGLDAVVVNPDNEQTGSVPQRRYWPAFVTGEPVDEGEAEERLKFVNEVLHITPHRGRVENALARLGARLFVRAVAPGATVNIGVGYPEEVCRLLYLAGLHDDLIFTTETGVYGGLPAPGIFFGAAINPREMHSSAWMFHHYRDNLDVAVLGILQVDSAGNVNVSRRGERVTDYVGPGGFPSIVNSAKTVIFVGTWMAGAGFAVRDGGLHIDRPGAPKFVGAVDEVTFSGERALDDGKQVYYVTNVGVFRLTRQGVTLEEVMPGIDVEADILAHTGAALIVPPGGACPVAPSSVVTGEGFDLKWDRKKG